MKATNGHRVSTPRNDAEASGGLTRSKGPRDPTYVTIAKNLEFLVTRSGIDWQTLAQRSGVSLRSIGYIRKGERSPSIETVDALAKVFSLSGWALLNPNLSEDYGNTDLIERLRSAYNRTNAQGKDLMMKTADIAATLTAPDTNPDASPT